MHFKYMADSIIEIVNNTAGEVTVRRKVKNKIAQLSKGNPGAATALTYTYLSGSSQDWDEFSSILSKYQLHGPAIWAGYKNKCDEDPDEFRKRILNENEYLITYMKQFD